MKRIPLRARLITMIAVYDRVTLVDEIIKLIQGSYRRRKRGVKE
jgi:hypothetical protein